MGRLVWIGAVVVAGAFAWWAMDRDGPAEDPAPVDVALPNPSLERPSLEGRALEGERGTQGDRAFSGSLRRRFRILGDDGQPVSGATLVVRASPRATGPGGAENLRLRVQPWRRPTPEPGFHGVSDAQGHVQVDGLRIGVTYHVTVDPLAPWCPAWDRFRIRDGSHGDGHVETIRLHRGVPVEFRVRGPDGSGLKAQMSVGRSRHGPRRPRARAFLSQQPTDAQGRLRMRAPAGVSLFVQAEVPTWGRVTRSLTVGDTGSTLEIHLGGGSASVVGTVRDLRGRPVAGAQLAMEVRTSGDLVVHRDVAGDGAGAFRVDGLPAGHLASLQAHAPGHLGCRIAAGPQDLPKGGTLRVDVVLPRGCTVRGRVMDEDGRPIQGARVSAYHPHRERHGEPDALWWEPWAHSDAEGAYVLEGILPGTIHMRAHKPGFTDPVPASASAGGPPALDITPDTPTTGHRIVLVRGRRLAGRVEDAAGQPVAGAVVSVGTVHRRAGDVAPWPRLQVRSPSATSDAEGRFVLEGVPEIPGLWVRARTVAGWSEDVAVGAAVGEDALLLVLRRGATLAGRLVVAEGADPDGLRIEAVVGGVTLVEHADQDGRFRILGVPPGDVRLGHRAGVFLPLQTLRMLGLDPGETFRVTWGQVVDDLRLEITLPSRVHGVVRNPDGTPAGNLRVEIQVASPTRRMSTSMRTDALGRFAMDVEIEGEIVISAHGMEDAILTPREAPWELRRHTQAARPRLQGRVLLPDGRPLPRGSGRIRGRAGASRGFKVLHGTFSVDTAPEDDEGVEVVIEDPRTLLGEALVLAPASERWAPPFHPLTIRLSAGDVIAGSVVDEAGKGVPGIPVVCRPEGQPEWYGSTSELPHTDAQGRFRVEGLAPLSHVVGLLLKSNGPFVPVPNQTVAVGSENLRFALRKGASLSGRIRGPDGDPVDQAQVQWYPETTAGQGTRRVLHGGTRSGKDGRFVLNGLPPHALGRLKVYPPREFWRAWPALDQRDVPSDAQDLELQFQHGIHLDAQVVSADGKAVASGRVRAIGWDVETGQHTQARGDGEIREGRFRIPGLSPGHYRVFLVLPAAFNPPTEPIVLEAGVAGHVITVDVGHPVQGRVAGTLPGGARVTFQQAQGASGGGVSPDGTFSLPTRSNAPGILHVRSPHNGMVAVRRNVRPSEGPFELELQPGVEIHGKIEGLPASWQILELTATGPIQVTDHLFESGDFRIRALPAGIYDLKVAVYVDTEHRYEARLEGVATGTKDVVIRVERKR